MQAAAVSPGLLLADQQAQAAAQRAGVIVDQVVTVHDLAEVDSLLNLIWKRESSLVPSELLRALAHAENCVLGAWRDMTLVGASVAFVGWHDGVHSLHSHVTGVLPDLESTGIGYALKLRQQAWSLRRGIDTITWTFDPLSARNAHFNLDKLGAAADTYLVDFYGALHDGVNFADQTDRLLAVWRLGTERAVAAPEPVPSPMLEDLLSEGAAVVLKEDDRGRPRRVDDPASHSLVAVPSDIVSLRLRDPEIAIRWRLAVREVMTGLFASGFRPRTLIAPGWYAFQKGAE